MARFRALTNGRVSAAALALSVGVLLSGCSGTDDKHDAEHHPTVVATTAWEAGFAKAAGIDDVQVIVPASVHHAPDYDPKPSDLTAVAEADFVLYAPFEPFAAKIKEAAGSRAKLIEVNLDNSADKVTAQVQALGKEFGTASAAESWSSTFIAEYDRLGKEVRATWPGGKQPTVVAQVFSTWAAQLAGAQVVGTYGPEAVTPGQLAELAAKKPDFVLDNAHMSSGTALPDSGAKQVSIVNFPGQDYDLLGVYRNAEVALKKAMSGS
ncbi:ABC transporter substrate-binding protein [Nocardia sp. NBC_01009]|uniref:ABC transporter substrate-binding protein n=1 Tax=Nocardia sp. NBC_01009 TaxID=2975996 RepID=UPI003865B8F8|nr:metal ABC transporter substrate-binding protein [Nocardia sp. NBC_01009]